MKKLYFMLCVFIGLFLISCGGGEKEASVDGAQVVLKVNMDVSAVLQPSVFEMFEERHPNIKIELEQAGDIQAHYTKMMSLLAANEAPDVFISQSAGYVNYVDQGVVKNISDLLQTESYEGDEKWGDTFIPALLDNARGILKNSTLELDNYDYGVPYMMTSIAVIYNKKIFEDVGIYLPKTWQKFEENNMKLKEAGYLPLQILNNDCIDWMPRLFWDQYMREVLDKDPLAFENGKIDFFDERIQKGLIEYKKMYDNGFIDDTIFVNSALQNQIAFIQGKIAQYYIVPESLKYILDNKPEDIEIGSFPLPGIAGLTSPQPRWCFCYMAY